MAPHYEEAATELKKKNIKVAKVDCVDQADLCQTNGIQGYPSVPPSLYWYSIPSHYLYSTLKVYRNGTPAEYGGPRKADGIISYMVKYAASSFALSSQF